MPKYPEKCEIYLEAEAANFGLGELYCLSGSGAADFE